MVLLRDKLPGVEGYEVQEKIGEGGIGTVYKAVQLKTQRVVAIKVIPAKAGATPKTLLRAEREFRSASRLIHPNVVQALDLVRDELGVYLIMEYVDGQSLGERIEQQGRLTEEAAVAIVTQVGQALHYVHKHDMVHRDIKPDNILLTRDGKAKLTDFGLVKELVSSWQLTDPTMALGTPHFMAPEQYVEAREVDARCDIYSLGATLYTAVTGQLPFGSIRSFTALVEKVKKGAVVPPRELVPELSEHVEAAIRKAMAPDPARRPRTCLEFVKLLMGKERRRQAGPGRSPSASRVRPKVKLPDPKAERRAAVRYPLGVATDCAVEASLHDRQAEADHQWPAAVADLSCGGLALVMARRLERGTVVVVDLETAPGKLPRSLQARVVRVQSRGYGRWLVGCQFLEPLSPQELRDLV
jgi:serine/threonine protein kinase